MNKNVNLLEGSIFRSLTKLAVPIMLTSLLQTAYSMTDMIWLGRVGSGAVAAVGSAGLYLFVAQSFAMLARGGSQVKVANAYGEKNYADCTKYTTIAIQMAIALALFFSALMVAFAPFWVSFFELNSAEVIADAENYLRIAGGLIIFQFINYVFTAQVTATGNSRTPLVVNTVGLVVNMVLDPIFIFGYFGLPQLGASGAAIATIIAQAIVTLCYVNFMRKDKHIFSHIKLGSKPDFDKVKEILRISIPTALTGVLFAFITMSLARIVTVWGDEAVAVQKVGGQIESITWMIADGFSASLNAFIAQNCGAGQYKRAAKGYKTSMSIIFIWSAITAIVLYFFAEELFWLFLPDANAVPIGVDYLRILSIAQFFVCSEMLTMGAFGGYGHTAPPAVVTITFTSLRIPAAIFLGGLLGVNGVWWAISLSCIIKGVIMPILFGYYYKKRWSQLDKEELSSEA